MVQVSSGNASLKMLSERDKEIGSGNELRGGGAERGEHCRYGEQRMWHVQVEAGMAS